MDTGGESQERFIRLRKQPNVKHELFMLLGMEKERGKRAMPPDDLVANRGALQQLADNELSTEMYPFIADSPLARLGWDPKRISFLPAMRPTGLNYEQRSDAPEDMAYPSLFRGEELGIPAGQFFPGYMGEISENVMQYLEPWKQEAIKRWGLENDFLDRMYVYTDKDEYFEDDESEFSPHTLDVKDQARTYRAQVAAHEAGHRGLEKILELYPQLRKELMDVTFSDDTMEVMQRLIDIQSHHGDEEGAIDWLKDKFPDDYKEKARAIKLNYVEPINELAKVLLEEQGRPTDLRPGEDFVKLWEPEKEQAVVGALEGLTDLKDM